LRTKQIENPGAGEHGSPGPGDADQPLDDVTHAELRNRSGSRMINLKANCKACRHEFRFRLVDNQINESMYAYCDRCGQTVLFYGDRPASYMSGLPYRICTHHEEHIEACTCGGRFTRDAEPRCPKCMSVISAAAFEELVQTHVGPQGEWNRPGSHSDWRSRGGQFCMIIEERDVRRIWRDVDT